MAIRKEVKRGESIRSKATRQTVVPMSIKHHIWSQQRTSPLQDIMIILYRGKLVSVSYMLTGMRREMAKVDAADVASSLIEDVLALAPKALAVLALLAPSVAKADRKTTLVLDELTPSSSSSSPKQKSTTTTTCRCCPFL